MESVEGENSEEGCEAFTEVGAAEHARKREHWKRKEGRGRRGDGAGAAFSGLATALGHDEIDWQGRKGIWDYRFEVICISFVSNGFGFWIRVKRLKIAPDEVEQVSGENCNPRNKE